MYAHILHGILVLAFLISQPVPGHMGSHKAGTEIIIRFFPGPVFCAWVYNSPFKQILVKLEGLCRLFQLHWVFVPGIPVKPVFLQ